MGKLTISMAIFHSNVSLPEGTNELVCRLNKKELGIVKPQMMDWPWWIYLVQVGYRETVQEPSYVSKGAEA